MSAEPYQAARNARRPGSTLYLGGTPIGQFADNRAAFREAKRLNEMQKARDQSPGPLFDYAREISRP